MNSIALCMRCPQNSQALVIGCDNADVQFQVHAHAVKDHHYPAGAPKWTAGDDYYLLGSTAPWEVSEGDMASALKAVLYLLLNQHQYENVDQEIMERILRCLAVADIKTVLDAPDLIGVLV